MDNYEPEAGDYILTPSGPLGGRTAVSIVDERYCGEFGTTEGALAFVRADMDKAGFWPSIWWVSDHGNGWPIDLDGNELPPDFQPDYDDELDALHS